LATLSLHQLDFYLWKTQRFMARGSAQLREKKDRGKRIAKRLAKRKAA
jgi:hypothetical protein